MQKKKLRDGNKIKEDTKSTYEVHSNTQSPPLYTFAAAISNHTAEVVILTQQIAEKLFKTTPWPSNWIETTKLKARKR